MNVHQLRHSAGFSGVPMVLPILPMVWSQADPATRDHGHRGDTVPGSPQGCSGGVDCPWTRGAAASKPCAWGAASMSFGLRTPEQDESPLSPSEAAIALRDFPTKAMS